MDETIALTSFLNYNPKYLKNCDIWYSKDYFHNFEKDKLLETKPSCFFVYSSNLYFKITKPKNFYLVICLVYNYTLKIVKTINFDDSISTCSFIKDDSKPLLFIAQETGSFSILDLDSLNDIKKYDRLNNNVPHLPIILSEWFDDKTILFCNLKTLYYWNIETGELKDILTTEEKNISLTFFTCFSFNPFYIAIGFSNGLIKVYSKNRNNFFLLLDLSQSSNSIRCLSFSPTEGNYTIPLLASISINGELIVWNLDKKEKLIEKSFSVAKKSDKFFIMFLNEFYIDNKENIPIENTSKNIINKKELGYFELLISNPEGEIIELKVPKSAPNSGTFNSLPRVLKKKQISKNSEILCLTTIKTFEKKLKNEIKKGDKIEFNENELPLMIEASIEELWFPKFFVWNSSTKKVINYLPTINNIISDIDICPFNKNLITLPDVNGILMWNASSFQKTRLFYDVQKQSKCLLRKNKNIRITCLNWHPEIENLIAFATRCGKVYVTSLTNFKKENDSYFKLDEELYIYKICWGPSICVTGKSSVNKKQVIDYLYCIVEKIGLLIIDIKNKKFLKLTDIADIFVNLSWTEFSWKSDYSLLAIGDKEGSIDIFANDINNNSKLTHIITINDVFKFSIEQICWHPVYIDNKKEKSKFENLIAIGSNDNFIKLVDLNLYIDEAKNTSDCLLPIMPNPNFVILKSHSERVFKLSWSSLKENFLASCSNDATVKVWNCNLKENNLVKTFFGHNKKVLSVRWSLTDPNIIFSGSSDSILLSWNLNKINDLKTEEFKNIKSDIIKPKYSVCSIVSNSEAKNKADSFNLFSQTEINVKVENSKTEFTEIKNLTSINELNNLKSDFRPFNQVNKNIDQKKKKQTKTKSKSLLTLTTIYDNCSTKEESYKDFDSIIKVNDKISNTILIEENLLDQSFICNKNQRTLLYGKKPDVKKLSELEVKNHLDNNDLNSAYLVKLLSNDLKIVIDEAAKNYQLTDYLVAMSASVSQNYWKQTLITFTEQLIKQGKIVIAAHFLFSIFKVEEALDLLVKNKLYKEALMFAKTKFPLENSFVIGLTYSLAKEYSDDCNYESEIKCWLSIGHYYEAARVLAKREDKISSNYCVKFCKIAHKKETNV